MRSTTPAKSKFKRIVLKLTGESLQNRKAGLSIDPTVTLTVAERVKTALDMECEVAIVIGGGNIIRGAAGEARGISRVTGDYMGMLATVINALALRNSLEKMGLKATVLSAVTVGNLAEPIVVEQACSLLAKKRIVIFAGGTGNPFFTTDTTAALRASEIGADVLLKATRVDGIYTSDPEKNKNAKRLKRISYSEALRRRLKIMDTSAFSLCMDNGIPIIVFDFFKPGNIRRVLEGKPVGTLVS